MTTVMQLQQLGCWQCAFRPASPTSHPLQIGPSGKPCFQPVFIIPPKPIIQTNHGTSAVITTLLCSTHAGSQFQTGCLPFPNDRSPINIPMDMPNGRRALLLRRRLSRPLRPDGQKFRACEPRLVRQPRSRLPARPNSDHQVLAQ